MTRIIRIIIRGIVTALSNVKIEIKDPFSGKKHGLTMPKDETSGDRKSRVENEWSRQGGYNDGLHGKDRKSEVSTVYLMGYEKGVDDRPDYLRGFLDGNDGKPEAELVPAYSIGWHDGKNNAKKHL